MSEICEHTEWRNEIRTGVEHHLDREIVDAPNWLVSLRFPSASSLPPDRAARYFASLDGQAIHPPWPDQVRHFFITARRSAHRRSEV